MTFEPEFKKALSLLPNAEKDKLILRLLKQNIPLANRLLFELVSTDSVQEKRNELESAIIKRIDKISQNYYSPGYLMMDARDISGTITQHVSVTKDKYGEINLSCLLLKHLLRLNNNHIRNTSYRKTYNLCVYIVSKVFKILLLIKKQHHDVHIEFKEDIETIGKYIGENDNLMNAAIKNGLDVNWLIRFEIPEDIVQIHKQLRENGYLK